MQSVTVDYLDYLLHDLNMDPQDTKIVIYYDGHEYEVAVGDVFDNKLVLEVRLDKTGK
jgi:hypothetical protein